MGEGEKGKGKRVRERGGVEGEEGRIEGYMEKRRAGG